MAGLSVGCDICGGTGGHTTYFSLGPAYNDYKDNIIDISRNYQVDKPISQVPVFSCCENEEFQLFIYFESLHKRIISISTIMVAFLICLIIWLRDKQPIRFRQASHMIFHLLIQYATVVIAALTISGGFTGECGAFDFVFWVLVPLMLFHYIVKIIQLSFIYQWSFSKIGASKIPVKWFTSHRWVLSSKTYPIAVISFMCVLSIVLAFTRLSPIYQDGDKLISTMRCYWWELPTNYTVAQYPSPACACYEYVFNSDQTQQGACLLSLLSTCVNGTTTIPPLTLDQTQLICTDCVLTDSPSADCLDYFGSWILSGACGYPSSMPDLDNCSTCFTSDRSVFFVWSSFIVFLSLSCLIGAVAISRMDDKLLIRSEIISFIVFGLPCILIVLAIQSDINIKQSFDFSEGYIIEVVFVFLTMGITSVISTMYPLAACVYWESSSYKQLSATASEGRDIELVRVPNSSTNDRKSSRLTNTSSAVVMLGLTGEEKENSYGDDNMQVAFALEHSNGFKIYSDFSCKEFTIENIHFLRACLRFYLRSKMSQLPLGLRDESIALPDEIPYQSATRDHVNWILKKFLKQGSDMEVNIPSRMRNDALGKIKAVIRMKGSQSSIADTDEDTSLSLWTMLQCCLWSSNSSKQEETMNSIGIDNSPQIMIADTPPPDSVPKLVSELSDSKLDESELTIAQAETIMTCLLPAGL